MALSLDAYYLQAITDASNSLERALPVVESMRSSLSVVLTSYTGINTLSGTMTEKYTRLLDSSTIETLRAKLTNPVVPASTEQALTDVDINLAGFTCNSNAIKTLSEAVYSYYPLSLSSLSVIPLRLFDARSIDGIGGLQFFVPRYADTLTSLVNSYSTLKNILISDNIEITLTENSIFDTTIKMESILTGLSSNVITISEYIESISSNVNSFFIKLDTLSQSAATSRASLLSDLSDPVYSSVITAPWHQSLVINAVKGGLRNRDMLYLEPYFGLSYVPAVDVKAYGYGLSISATISSYIPRTSTAYSYANSIYTSASNIYASASNFSNSISRNFEVRQSNITTLGISIDYYTSLFADLNGLANSITNLNVFAVNTQYHSNWLGIYASEQAWAAYTISTAQSNISTIYSNALDQSNELVTFRITYSNVSAAITNASLTPIIDEIGRQFSGVSSSPPFGLITYNASVPTTVGIAADYLSSATLLGNAVDVQYRSALDVQAAIIQVLVDSLDPVNSLSTVSALILSVPQMYATMNDIAKPLLNYISTALDDISTTIKGEFLPTRNIETLPTSYTIATVPVNAIRNMITTYSASLAQTLTGGLGYLEDMSATRADLKGMAAYIAKELNLSILSDLLTSDYRVLDQWTLTDYPGWDFTIQNAPVFDLLSYYPGSNSNLSTALNVAHSIAWKISEIFATVSFPSLISTANSLSASSDSARDDFNSLSATYANLRYYSNQVGDLTSWYQGSYYQYKTSNALAVYQQGFTNVSALWISNYYWPMPPPVYSYLTQIGNVQLKINGLVSNISYIHDIATEIGTAITNGLTDQDRIYHDEYLISAIAVCRRTLFLLKCIDVDWRTYIKPLNGNMYASPVVISNVTMPSLSDIGENLRAYTNLCEQYFQSTGLVVALNSLFPEQINAMTRNDVLTNYAEILSISLETFSNVNTFYSLAATWSPYSLYSNTISAYKASISYTDAVLAISSLSISCATDILAYESGLNLSLRTIFQEFTSSLSRAKNQTVFISLNDLSFIPNPATADTLFLPYSMNSNFILETTNVSTNIPNISPSISSAFKVYSDYIAFINCIQTIGSSISLVQSYALLEISNLSFVQSTLSSNGISFTFSAAELTSTYNADNILLLNYARQAVDCNSIVNVANFVNDSTINFGNSRYPYTYTTSPADASNWLGFFPTSGLTLSSYQRSWSENTNRSLYFFALSSGQPELTVSSWGSPVSPGLLRSIQTDPVISNEQFQAYYSSQSGRTTLLSDVAAANLAGTAALSAFILSYQEIQSAFVLNVSDAFTSNYVDDPNEATYIYYSTYTNQYTSPTGKHPSVWRFVDSNKPFVLSNDLFGNIPYTTEAERNDYFISSGFRRFLLSSNVYTSEALFRTPDQDKQNVYYLLNIAAKYVENQANLESKYDAGYGQVYQLLSIQSNTLSYIKNTLLSEQAATLATIGSLTTSLCNWDAYLNSVFPPEVRVGKCPNHLNTFDLNTTVSNYYVVAGRGSFTLISQPVYVTTSQDVVVYTALASRAASLSLPTVDYVKYISAGASSTNIAAQLGSLVDYVEGHNIVYSTNLSGFQYFPSYNGSELDKMIIWTSLALSLMPIYSNLSAAYNATVSQVRTWTYRKLLPQYLGNPPAYAQTYSSNGLPAGYDQYFGDTVFTLEPYPKQLVFPTNTTMNWALLLSGGVASTQTYWSIDQWIATSNAFNTLCNAFTVSSVIVDGAIYALGGSIGGPIAQAGFVPVTQVVDWMTKLQPSNIADTLSTNAKFLSNFYFTFSAARLSDSYTADFESISLFFPYRCLSAMEIMSQAFWTDAPEQWPFEISGGLSQWKWSSNTWPRTIASISGFTNHSGHLYVAPPATLRGLSTVSRGRLVSFNYSADIAETIDPYSTPYFMLMSDTTKRYGIPSGRNFTGFNYPFLNSISSNATSRANLLTSMFISNRFLTNTSLLSSLTTRMTPENRFLSFEGETSSYTRNAVIDISVTNNATNNLSYRIIAYSTDGVTPTNTYTGVSTVNSTLIFTSIPYRESTLSSFFASNLGTSVTSYAAPDPYTWYYNISLGNAFSVYASNVSASIIVDSLSATLSLSGQVFTGPATGFSAYGMNVAWPYIGTMLRCAPALKYTTSATVTGTISGTTLTLSADTALVSGSTISTNGIIPGTFIVSGSNSSYQISPTQSIPITVQSPNITVRGSITGGINGRINLTLSTSATLPAGSRVAGTGFSTFIEYGAGTSYTVFPALPSTPDRNNVVMTVTPAAKLLTGSLVGTTLTLDSPATLAAGDVLTGTGIGAGRVIQSGSSTSYVVSSQQPLEITAVPPTKTVTASISDTALTLSTSTTLPVGALLTGTGISANTTIVSGSGTSYQVSISQTRSSGSTIVTPATIPVTGSIIGTALTLSASAALSISDVLTGAGITSGTVIVASNSGTSYTLNNAYTTGKYSGSIDFSNPRFLSNIASIPYSGVPTYASLVGKITFDLSAQDYVGASSVIRPVTLTLCNAPTPNIVLGNISGNVLSLQSSASLVTDSLVSGLGVIPGTRIVSGSGTSYTVTPYRTALTFDAYSTPATISVNGSIVGTALTLSTSATLPVGAVVVGGGITTNTKIVSGSGTSYVVTPSQAQDLPITVITTPTPFTVSGNFDVVAPAVITIDGFIVDTTLTVTSPNPQNTPLPAGAVLAGYTVDSVLRGAGTRIVSGSGTSYEVYPTQTRPQGSITVTPLPYNRLTLNNAATIPVGSVLSGTGSAILSTQTVTGSIAGTVLALSSFAILPAGAVLTGGDITEGTSIVSATGDGEAGKAYLVSLSQTRSSRTITVTPVPAAARIFPGTTIVSGSGLEYVISREQPLMTIESITVTPNPVITTVTGNLIGNTLTLNDTIPLATGASITGAGVPENTTISVANVTSTTHTVSPARSLTNISMSVIPVTSVVSNLIGSFIGTALTLSSSASIPAGSTLSGLGIVPGTTIVSGSTTAYTLSPNQHLNLSVTVIPTVPPSTYSYLSGGSNISGTYSNTYSSASMLAVQSDSFAVSDRIKEALLQMPFANYLLPNTISYYSTPIVNMSFDISTGVYSAGEFLPPTGGSISSSTTISLGQPGPRTTRLVDTYVLSAILDQEGLLQLIFPSNTIGTISAFMQLSASISWSPTSTNFSGYAFLGSPAPLANSTVLKIDQLGFNQYISADLFISDQLALQNIASLSTILTDMFPNLNIAYSNLTPLTPISDGRTICFNVRLPAIKVFTTISTDTVYNIFNDSLQEANSLKSTLSINLSAVWVPGTARPGYSNYFIDGINGGGVRPDNTAASPATVPQINSYLGANSMITTVNGVYASYNQFRYGLSDTSAILSNANIYDSAVSNLSAFVAETEYSAIRWMNICTSTLAQSPYLLSDSPPEDGAGRAFIASVPPSIGYYWSSANSTLLDARMQEELNIFDSRATPLYKSIFVYDSTAPLPLPGIDRELLIDIISAAALARPTYSYAFGFDPSIPNTATVSDTTTFGYVLSVSTTYIYNQLSVRYTGVSTLSAYTALTSQMSNSRLYNQLLEDNLAIRAGHDAFILTQQAATTITTAPTARSIAQGLSNTTYNSGGITYSNQFVLNVKDQAGYSFSLNLLQTNVPYSKSYTSYTLSPFTDASYNSIALSPYTLASNITISSLDSNVSSPGVGVSGTAWSNLNLFNITDDGEQITYSISVDGTLVKGTTTIRANTISEVRLNVELTSTAFSLSSYYQVAGTLNKTLTFSNLGCNGFTGLSTHPIFSYNSTELATALSDGTGAATTATQRGFIAIKALSCISYTNLTLQAMTQSNIVPFTMSLATGISTSILNASGFIFLAEPPNAAGIDFYNTNTFARIPQFSLNNAGAFTQASNAVFNRPDIIVTEETARSYLRAYPYSNAYTSPNTFSFTQVSFNVSVLTFSGGITDTTLTLSPLPASLSAGAVLAGDAFLSGQLLGRIISGTTIVSGSGTTYTISPTQTISSNTQITATYLPFKDLIISSLATYNGGIGVYNSAYSNLLIKSADYTNNIILYSLSIAGGDVLGSTTVSLLQPSNATLNATLSYTSYFLTISEIAARSTLSLTLSSLSDLSNIAVTYSNLSIQGGSAESGPIEYTISIPKTGGGAVDAYGRTSLSKTTSGSFLKVNLSFTSFVVSPFYASSYEGISTDGLVVKDLSYLPPRLSNTWTENSRAPNLAVSGVSILSGIAASNFAVDAVSEDGAFINARFTGNSQRFDTTTEIVQSPSNARYIVNLSDPGHLLDLVKRLTAGYSLGFAGGGAAPAVESLTPLTVTVSYGGRLIDFTARLNFNYFGGQTQNINGYIVLGAIGTTYGGVKTDYRPIYTDPAGNVLQTSIYGSSYFSFKATIPAPLLNVPNYIVKAYTVSQITTILSDTIRPALHIIPGSFSPNGSAHSNRIAYFTTNTSAGETASNVSGYLFQTICGREQTAMFQAQEYFSSNANTTGYAPFVIDIPATPTYRYTFSMLSFTLSSLSFNMLSYSSYVPQNIQNTLANVYNISLAQTKYTKMTFPASLNQLLSSVSIFSVSAGPLTTANYMNYIGLSTLSTLSEEYSISLGSSLVHRTVLPDYMLKKLSDLAIYPIYSFSDDSATLSLGLTFTFHLANLQVDPVFESGLSGDIPTWRNELSNLIDLYYPRDEAALIAARNARDEAAENAAYYAMTVPGSEDAATVAGYAATAQAAYEAALASSSGALNKYNSILSSINDAVYNRIPTFRRSVLLSYQTNLISNASAINIIATDAPNIVDLTLADWSLSYANYDWVLYETLCSVPITLPNPNDYSFYNNNFPYYVGDIVAYSNNQLYAVCNVLPQTTVGATVLDVDPGTINDTWKELTNALVNTYYPFDASGNITSYWKAGSIVWANGGGSNDRYSLYSNSAPVDFPVSNDAVYDEIGRPKWDISKSISALALGQPPVPLTTPHKYNLTVSHPLILAADPAKNPKKWSLIPTSEYNATKGGFTYYSKTQPYILGNTVIYFPKLSILPRVYQVCNVTPQGGLLTQWTESTTIISDQINPASLTPYPVGADGIPYFISDELRDGVPYSDVEPGTATTNDLPRYGTAEDDVWGLPVFLTNIRRKTMMKLEFSWMNMMQNLDWATYLFYGHAYSNDRFGQAGYPLSIQTSGYSSLAGTGTLANVAVDTTTALTNPLIQFTNLSFLPLNSGLSSVSATAISAWSISLNTYSISVTLSGKELLSKTLSLNPIVTTFYNYTIEIVPDIAFKTQSAAVAALSGGILTSLASISSNLYSPLYFISKSISAYDRISSTFSTFSADMPVVYNTNVRSFIESICNTLNDLRVEASNNISIINSLSGIASTQIQTALALYTPTVAAAAAYESQVRIESGRIVTTSGRVIIDANLRPELANRAKTARQAVVATSNAYKAVAITAGTIAAAATKIAQNAVLMGTILSDTAVLVKRPSAYIDWNSLKTRVAKIESTTRGFGTEYDYSNNLAPYQKDYRSAYMDRIDLEALQTHVWSGIYNAAYGDVQTVIRLQQDINDRKTRWFNNGPVIQNLINLAIKASVDDPIAGLRAAGLLNPVQSSQGIRYIDFGVGLQSYPIATPGNIFGDSGSTVAGDASGETQRQNREILSNVTAVNYNLAQQNMLSNYWKCLLGGPIMAYLNQVRDPPRSVFSVSDNAYVGVRSLSLPTFTPNRYGNYPLMGGMIFTGFPNTITGPAGSIIPFSLAFDYGRSSYQLKDSNTIQGIVEELELQKMSPPEYVTDSSQFRDTRYNAPTNKDVAIMGKVGLGMVGMMAAAFQNTIDPLGLMSLIGPEAGMSWPKAIKPLNTATLSLCQLYADAAASNVAGVSPDPLAIELAQAVYEGQLDMWVLYNSMLEKLDSSTSANNGLDFSDAVAAPTVSNVEDPYATLQFIPLAVRQEGKAFDTRQTELAARAVRTLVRPRRKRPEGLPVPILPKSKVYPAPVVPQVAFAALGKPSLTPIRGRLEVAEQAVFEFKATKPKRPIKPDAPDITPIRVREVQVVSVKEYIVAVQIWGKSEGHAGPGSQEPFRVAAGSGTVRIRVDANGARTVVASTAAEDFGVLLTDPAFGGSIPETIGRLNERPGPGQRESDRRNALLATGGAAAADARRRGLARTTSGSATAKTTGITTYTTDYKIENEVDTKFINGVEVGSQQEADQIASDNEVRAKYDAAVEKKLAAHAFAMEVYESQKIAYKAAKAANALAEAEARSAFDLAQEQEAQRVAAANEEKLRKHAERVLEVQRENSNILKKNQAYQNAYHVAAADAEAANKLVSLARANDILARAEYEKAKAERKRLIRAQKDLEDATWADEQARAKAINDLNKKEADAANVEIRAQNVANAARADFDASRLGFRQAGSALAGIAEQGFALAGITTPTLRQAANEFLLNDDDVQITDLENNIASFAISQGISTASGNVADLIGAIAYDAIYGPKGEKLRVFREAAKQASSRAASIVAGAKKIRSLGAAGALFAKILKGFSILVFESASSYVKSIAAANTLPGGFTIVDDAVDATGKPIKGAAAYAARTASSATTTGGRIASGLGLAGSMLGAVLGAQQLGCVPPFPT